MKIKLIAYGISRDILKGSSQEFDVPDGASISDLKQLLISEYDDFDKLRSLRFAIGEDYQEDKYVLGENDEVVIIPPVSGG